MITPSGVTYERAVLLDHLQTVTGTSIDNSCEILVFNRSNLWAFKFIGGEVWPRDSWGTGSTPTSSKSRHQGCCTCIFERTRLGLQDKMIDWHLHMGLEVILATEILAIFTFWQLVEIFYCWREVNLGWMCRDSPSPVDLSVYIWDADYDMNFQQYTTAMKPDVWIPDCCFLGNHQISMIYQI